MTYIKKGGLIRSNDKAKARDDDTTKRVRKVTLPPDLPAIRRWDHKAIGLLYDEHQAKLRNLALRLTGHPQIAEDLVHDVFVALPKAIRNFRGDSSISTFLCGILVNLSRHKIRKIARRRKVMERLAKEPEKTSTDPERRRRSSEIIDKVQLALDRLPIAQRVVFILCEVEQYSSIEAAKIVQAKPETVRSRLFHAKRKLRQILGDNRI